MDLPKPILYQLVFQLYEREIKAIKIFNEYDASFVIDLIMHMRPFQAEKDEIIFAEGDVCNDIVVISRGSVRLSTSNGTKTIFAGICTDSNFFGDFEFYRNTTAIATYSAMKSSDLMSIHHSVFNKVIELSFDSGTRFMADLKVRYDRFVEVSKKPVGKDIVKAEPRLSTMQRSHSFARHAAAIASLSRERSYTEDVNSPNNSPTKAIGGAGPRVMFDEEQLERDQHKIPPRNLINHQTPISVQKSRGGMVNIDIVAGTPKLAPEKTISMRGNGMYHLKVLMTLS